MENFIKKYETDVTIFKPRINEDIYEHFSTLKKYSQECESIIECGVRKCNSPWALVYGLLLNNSPHKKLLLNDINPTDSITELLECTKDLHVDINFEWCNDLHLNLEEQYDMVFIDTWHVYGQLKRELDKFSKITTKYIIMHDTVVDGVYGETIRCKLNAEQQSQEFGIPVDEINCGLQKAIDEFLSTNSDWILHEHYTNNNGLTIIKKV
jgi:hypothetical protein